MIDRVLNRCRRSAVNWLLGLWTGLVFIFLFAPIVTAVVFSFNRGVQGRQTSSLTGLTTSWYSAAWSNGSLRHSITISFEVAVGTAVLACLLGTISGFVLGRHRGRIVRTSLEMLVYLLLIVPEIVLGVSLLVFYSKAGIGLGRWTLIAGHSPFTIAVVSMIVRARVVSIDRSTEEAAADLGAGRFRAFWDVTLPQVRPAILAGMLLAFTFSFDDLVISLFLTTPTVTTLPVYLFGTVQLGVRPEVYAIATMMLGFTLLLLAFSGLVYRWYGRQAGRPGPLLPGIAESTRPAVGRP